jgi:hypothetical protein
MSTEAQRRAQVAALEEMMDILEDLTVSEAEIERRIPQEALSGQIPTNVIIVAYQRRIARWRPREAPAWRRRGRRTCACTDWWHGCTRFLWP